MLEARHGRRHRDDAARQPRRRAGRRWLRRLDRPAANRDAVAADVERDAAARLGTSARGTLRPVINATGVVIHTNLGRAPLAEAGVGPAPGRGPRLLHPRVRPGHRRAGLAVGARRSGCSPPSPAPRPPSSSTTTPPRCCCCWRRWRAGREVLVSRGELVEIGGGFRVPDVMAQSGAALREVGTTNRTRVADYAASSGAATALVLRVHPSNFRIEGFTERPALRRSGGCRPAPPACRWSRTWARAISTPRSPWEPTVQASLAAGVDLVCVSGDKMLGGPQAGIVARTPGAGGSAARASADAGAARRQARPTPRSRPRSSSTGPAARTETVPVLRMLHAPVRRGAGRGPRPLAARLRAQGWTADGHRRRVGDRRRQRAGGRPCRRRWCGWPGRGWSADRLEAWLRERETPIIARIEDDARGARSENRRREDDDCSDR